MMIYMCLVPVLPKGPLQSVKVEHLDKDNVTNFIPNERLAYFSNDNTEHSHICV